MRLSIRSSFASHGVRAVATAILIVAPTLALAGDLPASRPSTPSAQHDRPNAPAKLMSAESLAALPHYVPPPAYSENLIIHAKGKDIVMKRSIDHEKTRMEMAIEGTNMITLQMGDEKGTTYQLMPAQKRAMKFTLDAKVMAQSEAADTVGQGTPGVAPADFEAEDLGDTTIDGVAAQRMRIITKEGDVLAWFEKSSGAPLRMESEHEGEPAVVEWKNRKSGPQPAAAFEVPKEYEVTDVNAMMGSMGGMGMGGMGMGGVGGMAKGMGAGMLGGMGANMGGSLGGMLGGSIGGPLGSVVGRYLGSKIGGAVTKKATHAIMK